MKDLVKLKNDIDNLVQEYKNKIVPFKDQIEQIKADEYDKIAKMELEFEIEKEKLIERFEHGFRDRIPGVQIKVLKDFEVLDIDDLPEEYITRQPNKSKIRATLRASGYTENIPGIKIKAKRTIAVRSK